MAGGEGIPPVAGEHRTHLPTGRAGGQEIGRTVRHLAKNTGQPMLPVPSEIDENVTVCEIPGRGAVLRARAYRRSSERRTGDGQNTRRCAYPERWRRGSAAARLYQFPAHIAHLAPVARSESVSGFRDWLARSNSPPAGSFLPSPIRGAGGCTPASDPGSPNSRRAAGDGALGLLSDSYSGETGDDSLD